CGDYVGALGTAGLGSGFCRLASGFRLPACGFLCARFHALGIGLGALRVFLLTGKLRCREHLVFGMGLRFRLWLAFLEVEHGVFLVAFGGEADVVELDFVHAQAGYVFRNRYVIILHFWIRRIGPDQLAVFAPGGVILSRLDGQFGMIDDQA